MMDLFNIIEPNRITTKDIIKNNRIYSLEVVRGEVFAHLSKHGGGLQISENGKVDLSWFNKSQRKFQKESEARTAEMCKTWKDREAICWYYEHKRDTA